MYTLIYWSIFTSTCVFRINPDLPNQHNGKQQKTAFIAKIKTVLYAVSIAPICCKKFAFRHRTLKVHLLKLFVPVTIYQPISNFISTIVSHNSSINSLFCNNLFLWYVLVYSETVCLYRTKNSCEYRNLNYDNTISILGLINLYSLCISLAYDVKEGTLLVFICFPNITLGFNEVTASKVMWQSIWE